MTKPKKLEKILDLDTKSIEELNNLKQQEEAHLEVVMSHFKTMRISAAKLLASKNALNTIKQSHEGSEIMIPLTESLYVPGKMKDIEKVTVELGTGFYVEKENQKAVDFLERKWKLVEENSKQIMKAINETKKNLEQIHICINGKLAQIRARQEGLCHQKEVAP